MGDRQPQQSLHRERWGLQKREGGASRWEERGEGTVLSRRPHCTLEKGLNSARGWKPCWLLVNLLLLLTRHSSVSPLPTPKLGQWDPLKAAVHRGPTHRSPGEPRGACCPLWDTALGSASASTFGARPEAARIEAYGCGVGWESSLMFLFLEASLTPSAPLIMSLRP